MGTKIVDGVEMPTTAEDDAQTAADAAAFAAAQAAADAAVPSPISRMQARVALASVGKLDTIDAFFANPDTPLTPAQREYWNSALEFHRGHPLIAQFGPMLGWTETQIDDLFRLGAGIA